MAISALITGASSGLGAEFARQLAMRGANVILVARDRDALEQLGQRLNRDHGVAYEVLVADLTKKRQLAKVVERVADQQRPVEVVVNNAGYGLSLNFDQNDIEDEARHLAVHVEAPMRISHAALGAMVQRGHGRIINVASVAAYLPRSTYGAVKAWVVNFSRWANGQYRGRGVTVTAVCPGFTHTDFHARMGLASGREGVPDFLWLDASRVVSDALRDVAKGKAVSVPSTRYKVIVALTKVIPSSVLATQASRGR